MFGTQWSYSGSMVASQKVTGCHRNNDAQILQFTWYVLVYGKVFKALTVTQMVENHAKMWTAERLLSLALVPSPLAFMMPIPAMDYVIAAALVLHVHWGLEAIVVDYIRPSIFGPVVPKVSLMLLYVLSALSLGGLFYFNYTDVGLVSATKMAWSRL